MRLVALPHQLHPRSDAEPLPSFPLSAEAATTIFEFTLERQELLVTCDNAEVGQQVRNVSIYGACGTVTCENAEVGQQVRNVSIYGASGNV
jgi:hypothetical protein